MINPFLHVNNGIKLQYSETLNCWGKPCSKCLAWLSASNYRIKNNYFYYACLDCERNQRREWRHNNPGKVKQQKLNYRSRHPDRIAARDDRYRKENLAKVAATQKSWREKNQGYWKVYVTTNREYINQRTLRYYYKTRERRLSMQSYLRKTFCANSNIKNVPESVLLLYDEHLKIKRLTANGGINETR